MFKIRLKSGNFQFRISVLSALLIMAFVANAAPSDSWQAATAETRGNIQNLQAQIAQQRAAQQAQQQLQLQRIEHSLDAIHLQQKALTDTLQPPNTTPTLFVPRPITPTTTTSNPWLKPNPWHNTVNPYPGQQYPTQIYVSPTQVPPPTQPPLPPPPQRPLNIFR